MTDRMTSMLEYFYSQARAMRRPLFILRRVTDGKLFCVENIEQKWWDEEWFATVLP